MKEREREYGFLRLRTTPLPPWQSRKLSIVQFKQWKNLRRRNGRRKLTVENAGISNVQRTFYVVEFFFFFPRSTIIYLWGFLFPFFFYLFFYFFSLSVFFVASTFLYIADQIHTCDVFFKKKKKLKGLFFSNFFFLFK